MRAHTHSLAFAGALTALLLAPSARAQAGPPVTTGAAVRSKSWVPSAPPAAAVLAVMTGGMNASSKPWLATARQPRAASGEAFLGLGAGVSSKPWIPNPWERAHVEVGPLNRVALGR